ncbi:MAG: DNA-directed RNA polymerase subunit beta', partial [Elusimicrobia bacterium]|nr:DNA-directed RNA polymerase subunit beta' [Elusimicrobiota bacterium]
KNHPVMLNRAPTLHRLGIQAFEPVLIEGKSIQLHPLTCAAFNADFDGDQMAVHVPLSQEAQLEAKLLMMATNNILSPASGRPIATPSHDMVLGIHYLTAIKRGEPGEGRVFADKEEVVTAYQCGKADLHARVKVRGVNSLEELAPEKKGEAVPVSEWKDYTTIGRVLFNEVIPEALRDYRKTFDKKGLQDLVWRCYKTQGHYATVRLLDALKAVGFKYATVAGLSISIGEMTIPKIKKELVQKARAQVKEIEKQAKMGIITEVERYQKVIDIWTHVTDKISDVMFDEMKDLEKEVFKANSPRFNAVYLMANSGARGSRQQVRQLAGIRGLMAKPQKKLTGGVGEVIENPIISNFREGLTVLEYFISTHGGRKGLSDTALKTADAGYLTRRLVDVAHDVVITEDDCGTINGIRIGVLKSGEEEIESLSERLLGRVVLEDVVVSHPNEKGKAVEETVVKAGEMVSGDAAEVVKKLGDPEMLVRVRSVLTCEADEGVCAKCYGMNNATGRLVEIGEAVGIIAAQSIGEPGTQLTLRTFHVGGTASRVIKSDHAAARADGKVELKEIATLKNHEGETIVVSRNGMAMVHDAASKAVREEYKIPFGSRLKVKDGEKVEAGHVLASWDPYATPIITLSEGKVLLRDVKEGVTLHKERNKVTGVIESRIIEHRSEKANPRIVVEKSGKEAASYPLPIDTILL